MNIRALARPDIVALEPYSSARREAPGQGVLLNANEAPHALLERVAIDLALNRYPDPQPAALAAALGRLYGVPTDWLLLTRGSDEGIDLLTRVFCRAGLDAVLECPPTFGMYRIAARIQGADVVAVPRLADAGFRVDETGVLQALAADPRIRILFLTSPNNPTGDSVNPAFLERLLLASRDRAIVVIDEAYQEFSAAPSAIGLIEKNPHLAVLRTLSKAWASAGLRCGAVVAQPALVDLLGRVIAPYPLPSPVTALALRVLEPDLMHRQRSLLAEIAAGKRELLELLASYRWIRRTHPGEANFVLLEVDEAAGLVAHCAARGVIVRGFRSDPALQHCVRITVGSPADLQALRRVLDDWIPAKGKAA